MSLVLTVYGRQQIVGAFFTSDLVAPPASLYVCYTTSVPVSNSDGSQLDEPDPAAGYGRLAYPLTSAHWSPSGYGEIYNATADAFAALTGEWGLIVGMALTDSAVLGAGNVLAVGSVVEPFQAAVGSIPTLDIGDITIGLYE